jgi:hypothetical protein
LLGSCSLHVHLAAENGFLVPNEVVEVLLVAQLLVGNVSSEFPSDERHHEDGRVAGHLSRSNGQSLEPFVLERSVGESAKRKGALRREEAGNLTTGSLGDALGEEGATKGDRG